MSILSVSDISKSYDKKKLAVENLSFELNEGDFFGFLGPNGAGKSTTISLLSSLITPDKGEIYFQGENIINIRKKYLSDVGFIFQDPPLDRNATVKSNLIFAGTLYNLSRKDIENNYLRLLKNFELLHLLEKKVLKLSGGEKRIIDICRALIHQPKILFMDEPTTGLDPVNRARIWDVINNLRKKNKVTIFLTTHYMDEASKCSKICFIKNGNIIKVDSPNKFLEDSFELVVEFNELDDKLYNQITKLLNNGLKVGNNSIFGLNDESLLSQIRKISSEYAVRKTNLNDVFLWLTNH
ncbi:MAG: ABC transporter ATP-binding protein [Hydrogenophilales bacterium]